MGGILAIKICVLSVSWYNIILKGWWVEQPFYVMWGRRGWKTDFVDLKSNLALLQTKAKTFLAPLNGGYRILGGKDAKPGEQLGTEI